MDSDLTPFLESCGWGIADLKLQFRDDPDDNAPTFQAIKDPSNWLFWGGSLPLLLTRNSILDPRNLSSQTQYTSTKFWLCRKIPDKPCMEVIGRLSSAY